jgi:DNA processing protein
VTERRIHPLDGAAATLANLRDMTPARLRRLLAAHDDALAALDAVRAGRSVAAFEPGDPEAAATGARWAQTADRPAVERVLLRRGTTVWRADGEHPIEEDFADRPPVLFGEGDRPDVMRRPRVAVVGTRSATVHGLDDARELGAYLAGEGVTVVSGLAIGIDGAVHEGALEAGGGVIGVVATGLDVVYPRRHRSLFERVRRSGLIVSECGFGVGPLARRFPIRNRIIAALADVVVVVEATAKGGSRSTAEHALGYGRPLFALPGSRRNPAAAGCNELIRDGAHPLLDFADVVVAIGMTPGSRRPTQQREPAPPLPGAAAAVLAALGGEPATDDELADRAGLTAAEVAAAVALLVRGRFAVRADGLVWPR